MNTKRIESGFILRGGAPARQPGPQNSPAVLAWVASAIKASPTLEFIKGENHK